VTTSGQSLDPTLAALGDALEHGARADLARTAASPAPRRVRSRRSTRAILIGVAALLIAVPSIAIAAKTLIGTDSVARSLPAGTLALLGTEPTCTVVTEGVEYHCILARTPAPEVEDWKGTVEPTVDDTKHVNGGCRSLRSDGLEWQCYLGQAAVDEQIIGQGFLGEYSPGPGVG
jgi:hypothetical protein